MKGLTDIQKDTLEFMIEYHLENNHPPSMRTIAAAFGITVKAVFDRIEALRRKGYVINGDTPVNIKTICEDIDYD
jgi:predicted transcriptional regulator